VKAGLLGNIFESDAGEGGPCSGLRCARPQAARRKSAKGYGCKPLEKASALKIRDWINGHAVVLGYSLMRNSVCSTGRDITKAKVRCSASITLTVIERALADSQIERENRR
jgi:hypothetical protein